MTAANIQNQGINSVSNTQDVANAIYLRAEMLRDDHANHRETSSL